MTGLALLAYNPYTFENTSNGQGPHSILPHDHLNQSTILLVFDARTSSIGALLLRAFSM